MPKEGISRREYRTKKFGSWEQSLELDAKMIAVGKQDGIHFAFDRMERTPNTLDAHRLIWLADKEGIQDAVVDKLFRAYFTEGRGSDSRCKSAGSSFWRRRSAVLYHQWQDHVIWRSAAGCVS